MPAGGWNRQLCFSFGWDPTASGAEQQAAGGDSRDEKTNGEHQ